MNSVHLIGRLATDVDVKEVNGGSKVSTFILAVDRNAEEADFFRIKAWREDRSASRPIDERKRTPLDSGSGEGARAPASGIPAATVELAIATIAEDPSAPARTPAACSHPRRALASGRFAGALAVFCGMVELADRGRG